MNINDLHFVKVSDIDTLLNVPKYLFEQIPDRDWDVDDLYKWLPLFILSPLNSFWVLVNNMRQKRGILWITIDPVVKMIAINVMSVDKQYQHNSGQLLNMVKTHLSKFACQFSIKTGLVLKKKMFFSTTRPKAFERKANCHRYGRTIMEVDTC